MLFPRLCWCRAGIPGRRGSQRWAGHHPLSTPFRPSCFSSQHSYHTASQASHFGPTRDLRRRPRPLEAWPPPQPPLPQRRPSSSDASAPSNPIRTADLSSFTPDLIRNFSIVAHVDHGKSTLADRILEHVGAIETTGENKQVLDKLQVERERGITVKAQTASVVYAGGSEGKAHLLNLIDTPGHVDFSSEVSRSLTSCQGVILLVDANQGVQAQTVSNFYLAFANDLTIIPVLNKVDLPNAQPEEVKEQLLNLFEINPDDVIHASAKTGLGIPQILAAVIDRIPPPSRHGKSDKLRLLLQDSWYDRFKGAVNLVQVIDGQLRVNDTVTSVATKKMYPVRTLGILTPEETPVKALYPGQLGYFTCNMRSTKEAIAGDTFHKRDQPTEPVVELTNPKPMVFAGFYPLDQSQLAKLKAGIEKVSMNDSSVTFKPESSPALGSGWRLGFLGVLHMEVFSQRLEQEYGASVVVTTPSVPYLLKLKESARKRHPTASVAASGDLVVTNPADWLDKDSVASYHEPLVRGTILAPQDYMTSIISLCVDQCRGEQLGMEYVDQTRLKMDFLLPLNEVVTDFFDTLKGVTSGYGSFDYEDAGYGESSMVKVDLLLNKEPVSELSYIAHASKAREKGVRLVQKLKDELPRQQFAITIQAAVGSKILCRADLKALRKDVTAKCYGGDITRKTKLLRLQAEGKKKLRSIGNVQVSKDVFVNLLTNKKA